MQPEPFHRPAAFQRDPSDVAASVSLHGAGPAAEPLGEVLSPSQIMRRGFVLASLGFLAACATGGGTQAVARSGSGAGAQQLPPGIWTSEGKLPPQRWAQPASPQASDAQARAPFSNRSAGTGRTTPPAVARGGDPKRAVVGPADKPSSPALAAGYNGKVIARTQWTPFCPNPKDMNPLGDIRKITVHHTGNGVFTDTGVAEVKDELQTVLRGEMGVGHDDIAYHYVIDPAGRVWAGRSLRWQGSHVRNWKGVDNRTGNVGVMVLGNFERQKPTQAQLATLQKFVVQLQKQYKIPRQKRKGGVIDKNHGVFTHQQLSPTECPGDNLQNPWDKQLFPRLLASV